MKRPWTNTVLFFSAVWIFYITTFSQTILFFDSYGYEELGKQLAYRPILEYFHNLNREPLYPLFIALNMRLADMIHIPYTNILLLSQGIILLITQRWLVSIFHKLELGDKTTAALILYFVLSPAVIRSSLIVYSEIITFPLILAAAVICYKTWDCLASPDTFIPRLIRQSITAGLVFLPLILVKGIFELIAPSVLGFLAISVIIKYGITSTTIKKAAIFFAISITVFLIPVLIYKTANQIFNGNFSLTDRGSWALYGTTARRALPVTANEELAQKLYVFPDKSLCVKYAGAKACDHWFYSLSDNLGHKKNAELYAQHLTPSEINPRLIKLSWDIILYHPIKTLKGMFWEGAKLFFWEWPSWGMVVLPKELSHIYQHPLTYYLLMITINALTIISIFFSIAFLLIKKIQELSLNNHHMTVMQATLTMIFLYIFAHSFFFLNERNALPLIPLYFILMGATIRSLRANPRLKPSITG